MRVGWLFAVMDVFLHEVDWKSNILLECKFGYDVWFG